MGKTAAAVNLSMISARHGFRTLLWDLDPQGAATHCYRARAKVKGGASRLLGGKRDLEVYVRRTDYENLDLLPADPSFRVVDTILGTRRWPERVLRKLVRSLEGKYDVVILDCAPGLGVVTESVVMASDLVLAPIIPAPLAVRSLDQLQEFVTTSRDGLPLLAFVSMLDERKVLHRQVLDQIRADGRFSLAAVPLSSSVERMGMEQIPAVLASPNNLSAVAYRRLWVEVEDRLDLEPPGSPLRQRSSGRFSPRRPAGRPRQPSPRPRRRRRGSARGSGAARPGARSSSELVQERHPGRDVELGDLVVGDPVEVLHQRPE